MKSVKPAKRKTNLAQIVSASDGIRLGAASGSVVHVIRKAVNALVPGDFFWWSEMDSEIGVSVHWVWLGHSAVNHVGSIADFNYDILLELLRGVSWAAERKAAIESVEGYEQAALKAAQERRRNRSIGGSGSLKPVEIPEPPPMSVEGKRLVHRIGVARAGYAAAVDERLRKQAKEASAQPPQPEFRSYKSNRSFPHHGLTRSKSHIVSHWEWETFSDHDETMDRLCSEPDGYFTHISAYGIVMDNVDRWRKAWVETRPMRELQSAICAAESRGEDVVSLSSRLQAVIRGETV